MAEQKRFYPLKGNIDQECMWWDKESRNCIFPKREVEGRESCDGIVDEVCLFLTGKIGSGELHLEREQIIRLKTSIPGDPQAIPAGPPLRLEE